MTQCHSQQVQTLVAVTLLTCLGLIEYYIQHIFLNTKHNGKNQINESCKLMLTLGYG